jgi:hypothetical protein
VHKESIYETPNGKLKPDLVLFNIDRVIVVDAQVITDQFPLERAHKNKVEKYNPLIHQLQELRPGGVTLSSFTINWRGTIAVSSSKELCALQVLKKRDLKILATRALVGAGIIWSSHGRMTVRKRLKKGEG